MDCLKNDKEKELRERKYKIDVLKQKIKELKKVNLSKLKKFVLIFQDPETPPEEINAKLQEIEKLGLEFLRKPADFLGIQEVADEYDYKRSKAKEPIENTLKLPYQKFEFYKIDKSNQFSPDITEAYVSGTPTGAFIKGLVRVMIKDTNPERGSKASSKKTATSCSVIFKSTLIVQFCYIKIFKIRV